MSLEEKRAIILCGPIGSGKSIAAQFLATAGWKIISAGDLVRRLCLESDLKQDRRTLQCVGRELLQEKGERYFGQLLLKEALPFQNIVFEGIRPLGAIREIRDRIPTCLVYIDADYEIRETRVVLRDAIDRQTFSEIDSDQLESLVIEVKTIADHVIKNTTKLGSFEREILGIAKNEQRN